MKEETAATIREPSTESPSMALAGLVCDQFVERQLMSPGKRPEIETALGNGTLKSEDWKRVVELAMSTEGTKR